MANSAHNIDNDLDEARLDLLIATAKTNRISMGLLHEMTQGLSDAALATVCKNISSINPLHSRGMVRSDLEKMSTQQLNQVYEACDLGARSILSVAAHSDINELDVGYWDNLVNLLQGVMQDIVPEALKREPDQHVESIVFGWHTLCGTGADEMQKTAACLRREKLVAA